MFRPRCAGPAPPIRGGGALHGSFPRLCLSFLSDTEAADPHAGGASPFAAQQKDKQLQVLVRDNNVDQALKVLKKKMQREGVFREMKARRSYEKPSERRARQRAEAVRRMRKLARKQAQREGLLPKKKSAAGGRR